MVGQDDGRQPAVERLKLGQASALVYRDGRGEQWVVGYAPAPAGV